MALTEKKSLLEESMFSADLTTKMDIKVDRSLESKPFVVVAIPAYNEEKTIAKVILQAQKYVDKVIVCDDGSRDMTTEIAERLGLALGTVTSRLARAYKLLRDRLEGLAETTGKQTQ